jgi:hypothetical protein
VESGNLIHILRFSMLAGYLFHTLGWAANHPIISLVILLFGLALIWSMVKAIMRLISTTSWLILQIPFKLIWAGIRVSFVSLTKFIGFNIQPVTDAKITNTLAVLPTNPQTIHHNKQQRLAEISNRLAIIQQEQQQLLQEAADLMATEKIN